MDKCYDCKFHEVLENDEEGYPNCVCYADKHDHKHPVENCELFEDEVK